MTASSSSSAEPAAPDPATVVPEGGPDCKVPGHEVGLRDRVKQGLARRSEAQQFDIDACCSSPVTDLFDERKNPMRIWSSLWIRT